MEQTGKASSSNQGNDAPAANAQVQTSQASQIPAIELPGGATSGIGEKFAANPVTGTGFMRVSLAASPGRSDFGPELSLSYNSDAGNINKNNILMIYRVSLSKKYLFN